MRFALTASMAAFAAIAAAQTDVRAVLLWASPQRERVLKEDVAGNTPRVIALLRDPDVKLRRLAAMALREMDPPKERLRENDADGEADRRAAVVDALAAASRDPDSETRDEAMISLITILRVRRWGHHGEPSFWTVPMKTLLDLGDTLVPTLASVLRAGRNTPFAVRMTALGTLAQMSSPAVLDTWLDIGDRDGPDRELGLLFAANYDDPRALRKLMDLVVKDMPVSGFPVSVGPPPRRKNGAIVAAARRLIGQQESPPRYHLFIRNYAIYVATRGEFDRYESARTVADREFARRQARKTIPELVAEFGNSETAVDAADSLFLLGRPAADALIAALPGGGTARPHIVRALGGTGDPRAVDLLLPLIDDLDSGPDAIEALGLLGDRRAVAPLLARLGGEHAAVVARALGRLRAGEAVEPLLQAIERDGVRLAAAEALATIGDPRALDRLLLFVYAGRPQRWPVVEAMGVFKDSRVRALLLSELRAPWPTNAAAARALGVFGDASTLRALRLAEMADESIAGDVKTAIERITKANPAAPGETRARTAVLSQRT